MRTDDLVAEQILPVLNALGNGEGDLPRIGNHRVRRPRSVRMEPVLGDLEPREACHVGLGGVRDLGTVLKSICILK